MRIRQQAKKLHALINKISLLLVRAWESSGLAVMLLRRLSIGVSTVVRSIDSLTDCGILANILKMRLRFEKARKKVRFFLLSKVLVDIFVMRSAEIGMIKPGRHLMTRFFAESFAFDRVSFTRPLSANYVNVMKGRWGG